MSQRPRFWWSKSRKEAWLREQERVARENRAAEIHRRAGAAAAAYSKHRPAPGGYPSSTPGYVSPVDYPETYSYPHYSAPHSLHTPAKVHCAPSRHQDDGVGYTPSSPYSASTSDTSSGFSTSDSSSSSSSTSSSCD